MPEFTRRSALIRRRDALHALTAGGVAVLVAGCGGRPPAPPSASNPEPTQAAVLAAAPTAQGVPAPAGVVKISMVSFLTGPDGAVMQDIVNGFNKKQDKVHVDYAITGWGNQYITKLETAAVSGSPPDVAGTHNFELPTISRFDYDLTGTEKTLGLDPENYVKLAWDIPILKGKRYGYCLNFGTMALYYNKDLFQQAGLDPEKPPTNAQEFLAAAKKITNPDKGVWGYAMENGGWFPFPTFMLQHGGNFMNADQTKITFNDQPGVEALQLLQEYTHQDNVAPATFSISVTTNQDLDLYYAGKCGMVLTGPWELSKNLQFNEEKGTHFAWAKHPQIFPEKQAIYSTTHIYQILKPKPEDAARKDAGLTWLKYLLTDGQAEWARAQAVVYLPAQEEIKKSSDVKVKNMQLWIDQNPMAQLPPTLNAWPQINQLLMEAFGSAVFTTNKPAKQALDDAASKATALIQN